MRRDDLAMVDAEELPGLLKLLKLLSIGEAPAARASGNHDGWEITATGSASTGAG